MYLFYQIILSAQGTSKWFGAFANMDQSHQLINEGTGQLSAQKLSWGQIHHLHTVKIFIKMHLKSFYELIGEYLAHFQHLVKQTHNASSVEALQLIYKS